MNKMRRKIKYNSLSYQKNIFCSCLMYDSFGYSKIGQLKSIGDEKNASVYAKNGTYGPTGHFKSLTAGNGKIFVNDWNPDSDVLDGYEWGIDGKLDNELTWNNRGNLIKRPVRDGMNWFVYCRYNPLKLIDPNGLTTLDDFYYQKVTNAETQEEKETYLQKQTQFWTRNKY